MGGVGASRGGGEQGWGRRGREERRWWRGLTGSGHKGVEWGAVGDSGVDMNGLGQSGRGSDRFSRHPRDVGRVGDVVRVRVLSVDGKKKRIALTMKGVPQPGTV